MRNEAKYKQVATPINEYLSSCIPFDEKLPAGTKVLLGWEILDVETTSSWATWEVNSTSAWEMRVVAGGGGSTAAEQTLARKPRASGAVTDNLDRVLPAHDTYLMYLTPGAHHVIHTTSFAVQIVYDLEGSSAQFITLDMYFGVISHQERRLRKWKELALRAPNLYMSRRCGYSSAEVASIEATNALPAAGPTSNRFEYHDSLYPAYSAVSAPGVAEYNADREFAGYNRTHVCWGAGLNFSDSIDVVEKFTAIAPMYDAWYGNPYLKFDSDISGSAWETGVAGLPFVEP